MSTVKLDLHGKTIPQKIAAARAVETKLGTPVPSPYAATAGDLKSAADALEGSASLADAKQKEADALFMAQNESESEFDSSFNAFGTLVQSTTKGDKAAIIATGLDVRKEPGSPVANLDPVVGFNVTTTNAPGTFDFAWDRADGAQSFELRWRKATNPAGQYDGTKTTTKTRLRVSDFEVGTTYIFDLRAHGSGEVESAWCDPFTKVAS